MKRWRRGGRAAGPRPDGHAGAGARASDPAAAIEVACASNREFLPHLAAMLHSLLAAEPGPLRVHLFLERDAGEAAGAIERMVRELGGSLEVRAVPYELIGDLDRSAPPATWVRVFLPELLRDLGRVLYLDADLIVTGALRELWETDLEGACLGAVSTVFPSPQWGEVHCRGIGLPSTELYFNGGVLLLDLASLRAGEYPARLVSFARAHASRSLMLRALEPGARDDELRAYARDHPGQTLFGDNDALSAVLGSRRLPLHPRWNCMNQLRLPWSRDVFGQDAVREALAAPAIRHFEGVGDSKPWHPAAEPDGRELYLRHRNRTPWPLAGVAP